MLKIVKRKLHGKIDKKREIFYIKKTVINTGKTKGSFKQYKPFKIIIIRRTMFILCWRVLNA